MSQIDHCDRYGYKNGDLASYQIVGRMSTAGRKDCISDMDKSVPN